LDPVATLRTATSESAVALGIASEVGQLQVGLDADILVVEGDPLRDLSVLQSPRAVFSAGHPVSL
jgi:imidazolonepropionase-like amidohydrolase